MHDVRGNGISHSQHVNGFLSDNFPRDPARILYDSSSFIPDSRYPSVPQAVANAPALTETWNRNSRNPMLRPSTFLSPEGPVQQRQDDVMGHPSMYTPSQTNTSFHEPILTPNTISEETGGAFTPSESSVPSGLVPSQPRQATCNAPASVTRPR